MKKNTQIILYSALAVVTIAGIVLLVRKPKDDDKSEEKDAEVEKDDQKVGDVKLEEALKGNKLVKGVQVYTKVDNVNVRDSKAVDNSFPTNLYGVIAKKGTLLGTVTRIQTMPDGFTWIGVKLTTEAYNEIQEGKSFLTRDLVKTVPAEKYVRQDVVKL
jgi:hypothetical protein